MLELQKTKPIPEKVENCLVFQETDSDKKQKKNSGEKERKKMLKNITQ